MKKLVLVAALFGAIGFGFANNNVNVKRKKQENKLLGNKKVQEIDFKSFLQKVTKKEIKIVKCYDFIFNDSCGGSWHVTGGSGRSMIEVMDALEWFNSQVCP